MAGLDQSGDEGQKLEARREIALPILTNMAASFLELRRPKQALDLCDQALAIDADCVKALLRKGKALLDLDRYVESRAAFDEALGKSKTPAETRDSEVYRRKATELNKRVRIETDKYKSRLRNSFASTNADEGLYADKKSAVRKRRTDTQVDKVLAECFDDGAPGAARATGAAPRAAAAPARPQQLTPDQKQLISDCLIVLWMLLCAVVVVLFVNYGEAFATYVTQNYLLDDDAYRDDDDDDDGEFAGLYSNAPPPGSS